MRDGDGCDQGVVGPGRGLASRPSQVGGDPPEGPRSLSVQGQGVEVRLSLLQMGLTSSPLRQRAGDERPDRQLSQRHRRDERLLRQLDRIQVGQVDQRRGIP
ncbi:hypothetical protein BJF86_00655 [Serinicoccus sp. CNJ-927]|nr:hypothetical protein BJF80_14350 [Serinicoccus sp. CUA-874]OLT43349.1 hypothetical protein BJF86_00655 [Serinicoccus sp. CNJ-927]